MLKITLHEEQGATIMRLDGKLIGPWADTFYQAWRSLADSLGSKRFCVDLRQVVQMDSAGSRILAEIFKKTGADFIADTPITKYFAEQARGSQKRGQEDL